jgi:3-oxoacyl-[acyl-carrier-protein] synthase-3
LAVAAARKLFESGACSPEDIDYLLLCTQSPDYFLPTTACLLQDRLGIPTGSGALDFNLGCSGYVYGLGLAEGLLKTEQASNVLLITAETYTKFIYPEDRSVRTIFGDAAAATLLTGVSGEKSYRTRYVLRTDGRGGENLIVPAGGLRQRCSAQTAEPTRDDKGNVRTQESLYMNGPEVFNFTLQTIPDCVRDLLARADMSVDDIDLFVFHQANRHMLEHLRKKLGIPAEKFYLFLAHCGNTVSSTIPIALKEAVEEGRLKEGDLVMLVGFGVGYSWGATLLQWPVLGYLNGRDPSRS